MCGIAAIVGNNTQDIRQLENLLAPIAHRGEPAFFNESLDLGRCVLGMNRLAIVDRAHAKQPMHSTDGRYFIVFNGEIYNYKDLQSELVSLGCIFSTDSDTEVLVNGYAAWGEALLQKLNGMYAFFIYDNTTNGFFAARDLFGVKPLYWTKHNDTYYFASEIKSLAGVPEVAEVELFPPAHFMKDGVLTRYWSLPENIDETIDEKSAIQKIRELFDTSIQRRVQTDLPIAVFLSGGIDSTAVIATARKFHRNVSAIITGTQHSTDRQVATRYCEEEGIPYFIEEPPSEEELSELLPEAVRIAESFEPNMVRNIPLSYLIAKRASVQGFKVILCGEGSDELFAGYPEFENCASNLEVEQQVRAFLADLHRTQLQRVDRSSMAVTTEVREPFLDKDLVEYALRLSGDLKIRRTDDNVITKYILRKAMEDRLPEYIYNRRKIVFSEGAGFKGNQPIGGFFSDIVCAKISDSEFAHYMEKYPEWHLATKEEVYYFKHYERYGYTKAVFNKKRTTVNKTASLNTKIVSDADSILSVFKTRRFKRAPFDTQNLLSIVHRTVDNNSPLKFVMYWGKGTSKTLGTWEVAGLNFLEEFLAKIKAVYPPGAELTIIFTDTHASLNGHSAEDIHSYENSLRHLIHEKGHVLEKMSDYVTYELNELEQKVSTLSLTTELRDLLEESAAKHNTQFPQSLAASLYYLQNQKEKTVIDERFKGSTFLTYNGPELDDLLPTTLPIFHMYSFKRGVAVKPWFRADE